jgi:probable HAF family extracellular repeat protein
MERRARMQTNRMKEAKRILKALACSAVIGLASATGSAKATDYEIIKLAPPDPNCNYSYASSINNNGTIIGIYGKKLYKERGQPFAWEKHFLYSDGMFKELNVIENYPRNIIDDWGDILVGNPDKPGIFGCVIHTIDEIITLDFCGSDMNNKGEVVGYYGYLYRNGEIMDLRTYSGGYGVRGMAINDNTQVVGYTYGKNEPQHAFIWDNNEMRIFKGPLSHNYVCDINIKGQFVGAFSGPGTFACMWDKEGNLTKLGEDWSRAYAINDVEQVVGEINAGNHGWSAFLYENGEMKNLNDFLPEDFAGILKTARGINNKGQILVSYGNLVEDSEWREYAFLLTPKPKTLEADLNDDGIVDGKDLAEFADQWLMTEDWYEK